MKYFHTLAKALICSMKGLLVLFCTYGPGIAATPYPAPFPNTVNSVFGPRHFAGSPVHSGIDYLQSAGTAIPAASNGYINDIKADDGDRCGVRLYLVTGDKIELGYCHLFTDTEAAAYASGNFILLKNYSLLKRLSISNMRANATQVRCNIILMNDSNQNKHIALVPQSCAFAVGRIIYYNKVPYVISNKVAAAQSLAPVGNSGSAAATGPHLHLNYGRGKDSALQVIDHPNGSFCARLTDAGPSTSACDAVEVVPVIQQRTLIANRYIEVRIDSTNRLDLDQAQFSVASLPSQNFNLQYGGTNTTGPFVNRSSDLKSAVDIQCSTVPASGSVLICPLDWQGQRVSASRLETKFRLGVDPSLFAPGNYSLQVTLRSVTGSANTFTLPFMVGGAPTATLLVADVQAGWSGLPATISLTNLVQTPIFTFQINGNSATCGTGERGSPLFSSVVPASAKFYAARSAIGVPYQTSGPGINRNNCSSFVAVQMVANPLNASQTKPRVWINATGRGQQFSTFVFDWESQVRFDSGDPWSGAGRSCVGGTVANSGFFGAAWSSSNCNASLNF